MYKNKLLSIQQKRSITKGKKNYSKKKTTEYYIKKQWSNKRKVKKSIQKLVKRRKRQD